jgi:hypothetical protein
MGGLEGDTTKKFKTVVVRNSNWKFKASPPFSFFRNNIIL